MSGFPAMSARGNITAECGLQSFTGNTVVGIAAVLRVGGSRLMHAERALLGRGSGRVYGRSAGCRRPAFHVESPVSSLKAAGFRSSSEPSSLTGVRHFWQYMAAGRIAMVEGTRKLLHAWPCQLGGGRRGEKCWTVEMRCLVLNGSYCFGSAAHSSHISDRGS